MKGCSKHVSSVVAAARYCNLTPCRFHPFSKHPTKDMPRKGTHSGWKLGHTPSTAGTFRKKFGGAPKVKWPRNGQTNSWPAKIWGSSAFPAICLAIFQPFWDPPPEKWPPAISPAISLPFLVLGPLPIIGPYSQYGWDSPEEIPEKFQKDPGPGIPLESTAGIPQTL